MSTTSMDIQQPRRRERRHKNQTFYPCPASFSEPDQYEYSSDDDESSYDGDGFKNTLVSQVFFNVFWNVLHVARGFFKTQQVVKTIRHLSLPALFPLIFFSSFLSPTIFKDFIFRFPVYLHEPREFTRIVVVFFFVFGRLYSLLSSKTSCK